MFLRTVRAAGAAGSTYEYIRLVEAYREGGTTKHRTVANLGRKDLLAPHADALLHILTGAPRTARNPQANAVGAWDWGPMLVARTLWKWLGLDRILSRVAGGSPLQSEQFAERALVLTANRLCRPASEHRLARWLETDFVCDEYGRRWEPAWRKDAERLSSKLPRVRVEFKQLKMWYRTLDHLIMHKKEIEKELFLRLRDLFSLQVDLVFYDLTSTYFEGHGPDRLAKHGHSRDGKPRNRQVLVGLVMVQGWPLAHHVFAGNWRDANTIPQVLEDLAQRFGLRRVVFVGDRGMITSQNLSLLRSSDQGYVMGLPRRRREETYQLIEKATGPWLPCDSGITNKEKASPCLTQVQEVCSDKPGVRVFVVQSEERLQYEKAEREKAMVHVHKRLEKLAKRVAQGAIKAPEKIGAAATRILQYRHGHRYYDWSYTEGEFCFFEHPVYLAREKAFEGKYLIQTEEKDLTPQEAVRIYKELSDVERGFATLKDVIELRPIYHQTDSRVQAHIFVAALAFLLHRALEKKLKAAQLDISSTEALEILKTVRVVDIQLGDGTIKRCVTRGSARAAAILRAVGIAEPQAPPLAAM